MILSQSSKPALVKNGVWKDNPSEVTAEQQRDADRNVANILYRSLKNQEKKAKEDILGKTKSMFKF